MRSGIRSLMFGGAVLGLTAFWLLIGFPILLILLMAVGGPSPEPINDPRHDYIAGALALAGYAGSLYLLRRWSR